MPSRDSLFQLVRRIMQRNDLVDADLVAYLELAQPDINRRVRVNEREHTLTFTATERATNIHAMLEEWVVGVKALSVTDSVHDLDALTSQAFLEQEAREFASGYSSAWTYSGGNILLSPIPGDAGLELRAIVWRGYTVPEQSGDTNWLLDNHPDLYAYAVAEKVAEFYLEDLETADKYMARFDRAIEALDEVEKTAFIPRGAHVYHTRRPISRFSLAHRI